MVKTLIAYSKRIVIIAAISWLQTYAPGSNAANDSVAWTGELYGGEYYDDSRVGAYFVSSAQLEHGATVIGEVLHENYTDYDFTGIGAHLLWPVGTYGDVGLVVSQAWETYEFESGGDTDYQTRTLALEWEFEQGPLAIAAQAGTFLKNYAEKKQEYVSADIYFWGEQYDWYLRGAVRRVSNESLHIAEGYRIFDALGHNVTAYAGMSADDLDSVAPGGEDSIYTGAYTEIFSTAQTMLTLWVEAAREDDETLLTIELNLAFGPGARTPYITAFGFSLDD